MIRQVLISIFLLTIIMGCGKQETVDVIYKNGKIYTVNEDQPWAEAVALKDGKFIKVGSNENVESLVGENTEVVDLDGKFVMPGMIDVHTHAIDAHVPAVIRLKDANDVDKIIQQVKSYVEAHPDQEWVIFGDFGFGLFPGDNGPKELLDAIAPNTAVAIQHASGHAFWVNSKALELAGITADTPDPELGIIARKPNGEPAGGLQETAMKMIWKTAPAFTEQQIEASVKFANTLFASNGITATREAGMVPERWAVIERMEDKGSLKIRYKMAAHWQTSLVALAPPNDEVKTFILENKDKESNLLKLDAIKIYIDGVPASHTALLKEAYLNEPENFGTQNIPTKELNDAVVMYDKLGVTSMFHVLGDLAAKLALDAVEEAQKTNGNSGLRHHLSHCIIVDEKDFPRFKELDIVADFSPFFPYRGPVHDNHIPGVGEERFDKWYPVKSLMDQGVIVAIATDYPVSEINPFVHMESAHTRMDPHGKSTDKLGADEAITVEEAIKAYTLNPAYILGWEKEIGSIEPGKLADMVVLNQNPLEVPDPEISEIKVLKTLLSGEVIYDANTNFGQLINFEESRLLALSNLKATGHVCAKH